MPNQPLTLRPATHADLDDFVRLWNLVAWPILGRDDYTRDEIVNEWQQPGWSPETHTQLAATPDGQMVAFADVVDRRATQGITSLSVIVHPNFETTGIGPELLAWCENRLRQTMATITPPVPTVARSFVRRGTTHTEQILRRGGYQIAQVTYRMAYAFADHPTLPQPLWPVGVHLRPFVPERDDRAVYALVREVFANPDRPPLPFEEGFADWRYWNVERDKIEAWMILVVVNEAGEAIGTANCYPEVGDQPGYGWLGNLAVRADYRGKGIALAILQQAFAEFQSRGLAGLALGVDADNATGAVRLYEKAGMQAVMHFDTYEKPLEPDR